MINWHRVGELRDDVGAEDFEDVVELFLEEVAEVVARLSATPDASQLGADLHFLKGSALNLGFDVLGKACGDGERLALNGQAAQVDLSAVIETYETSIAQFKTGLQQGQAA